MRLLLIFLLLFAGDYNKPARIAELEATAMRNQSDLMSRLELAEIFVDQENYKEAERYLEQAHKIDSTSAELLFLWGKFYDSQDNIPAALEKYSLVVACDSTHSQSWRKLGYIYEITCNYKAMLNCFKNAIIETEDSAGVYYDIGVTYDYLDSIDLALESYYKALKRGADFPEVYFNIGVDWGLAGYSDSAFHYFSEVLNMLDSTHTDFQISKLYYNIGILMMESGAYEQAMDNFMKTLSCDPDFSPAKLQMGYIYEIMNDTGLAKVYFNEFVQTAPVIYLDDINKVKEKLAKYNYNK